VQAVGQSLTVVAIYIDAGSPGIAAFDLSPSAVVIKP
jgi:hypothetical protein